MKILWVSWKDITHPDAGGAEIVGHEHAKAWVDAGHSIHWVSTGYSNSKKNIQKDGISFEHIGKRWFVYIGIFHIYICFKYFFKWKSEYDFIVDEYHGVPTGMPLYVRKPMIAVIHEVAGEIWQKMFPFPIGFIGQYIAEPIMLSFYKKTPIWVGSDSTRVDLIHHNIPNQNIHLIPYGTSFPNIINKDITKSKIVTVISLGELRPMKGFDRVYEIFKNLKMEIPNARLWVVGNDNTALGKTMKQLVQKDGNDNSVEFFGKVSPDKKFELLQKAHLLFHGSYKEGWGLVVIEANAVGTPAIAFDVEGLHDSIRHNETGFLAKNNQEFVEYAKNILKDINKYKMMQNSAIQWSQNYSWEKAKHKSLELIKEIFTSWKY